MDMWYTTHQRMGTMAILAMNGRYQFCPANRTHLEPGHYNRRACPSEFLQWYCSSTRSEHTPNYWKDHGWKQGILSKIGRTMWSPYGKEKLKCRCWHRNKPVWVYAESILLQWPNRRHILWWITILWSPAPQGIVSFGYSEANLIKILSYLRALCSQSMLEAV